MIGKNTFKQAFYGLAISQALFLAGCGGGGDSANSGSNNTNNAPVVAIATSGILNTNSTTGNIETSVGAKLAISGSKSSDADGDTLSFSWSLAGKPASSAVALAPTSSIDITFSPDVIGLYDFVLKVTDTKGTSSERHVKIDVNNQVPITNTLVTVDFNAPSQDMPAQTVSTSELVTLDASGSTDPDGDTVNLTWTLVNKPVGSTAALTITDKQARFTPDLIGQYKVLVRSSDGKSVFSEQTYTFNANNRPPTTQVATGLNPVLHNGGSSSLATSLGYEVLLDGSDSTDADNDTLSYEWTIVSKPAASTLILSNTTNPSLQLTPDTLGDYVIKLTAKDPAGTASYYTTTIQVNNQRPVATVTSNATPISRPDAPAIRLPVGTELTLRGGASLDADGDKLSYIWSIVTAPAASKATLSSTTTASTMFIPDQPGNYVFKLKVSDPSGAYSEQTINLYTGNIAPVAVLDRTSITTVTGTATHASANLSFDEDGDALSYSWSLDAKPAGSKAKIDGSNTSNMSFTPDLPGTYSIALTANDGKNTSTAYLGVKALASAASSIDLSFAPKEVRYSTGLDKMILTGINPYALYIIDPLTGGKKSVPLPEEAVALNLSPNGKLASVLYDGTASLINLEKGTLIKTFATGGQQTDVFVNNNGYVYLIGQTGGQWVDLGVNIIDGYTGSTIKSCCSWSFYGTQKGIYADKVNKAFLMSFGLSPADIEYFTLDPVTGTVLGTGNSPYHGDYSMSTPLFLSENQNLLFTANGNYFSTNTLKYEGKLKLSSGNIMSISHSSNKDEALVISQIYINDYPTYQGLGYSSSYQLFSGSLLTSAGTLPLPLINGKQSYGLRIFHSGNGSHVVLVQTETYAPNGAGAKYHIIYR